MQNSDQPRFARYRLPLFLLVYFLLGIILHAVVLNPDAHWSGDCAIKSLQADILVRSSFRQLSIPYSAEQWDPDGVFFPFRKPFAVRIGENYYSSYPVFFGFLLALFRTLFGGWGSAVLVAGGSTAFLFFSHRLAREVVPQLARYSGWILGFASPVWIYTGLVWGHTPAAACFAAGIWFAYKAQRSARLWHWLAAGIAFGVATWIRTEGYALAAALIGATMLWSGPSWKLRFRNALQILLGFIIALVPLAVFNAVAYGSPWGPHAASILGKWGAFTQNATRVYFGGPANPWYRLAVADWLFIRSTNYGIFSLKCSIPFLLFLFTALVPRLREKQWWIHLNLGLILLVLLRVAWEILSAYNRYVSGLWIVMPYSILAFWYLPRLWPAKKKEDPQPVIPFLFGFVGIYFFISVAFNLGNMGGLQWGPRYLMPVFGVLVVLALRMIWDTPALRTGIGRALIISLILFAVVIQLIGIQFVRYDQQQTATVLEHLRSDDSQAVVAYGQRWLAQMCAPIYFEKDIHLLLSPEDLERYFDASKPYSNDRAVFLSFEKPLPDLVPAPPGQSLQLTPRVWLFRPDQQQTGLQL